MLYFLAFYFAGNGLPWKLLPSRSSLFPSLCFYDAHRLNEVVVNLGCDIGQSREPDHCSNTGLDNKCAKCFLKINKMKYKINPKLALWSWTKQIKEKSPRAGIRNRNPLVYTLINHIKTLNWKP